MVPPSATALLRGVKPFAAPQGVEMAEENGMLRVRATGTAAHAARPEGGVSAIHLLATALLEAGVLSGQSEAAMRAFAQLSRRHLRRARRHRPRGRGHRPQHHGLRQSPHGKTACSP